MQPPYLKYGMLPTSPYYKSEQSQQALFSFKANLGELRKYVAIDGQIIILLCENKSKN
jgi:hypothetical protein